MWKSYLRAILFPFVLLTLITNLNYCSTGVESSSEPGILRITLQSDPEDTSIVIVTDTFTVTDGDSFGVNFFQSKVYNNYYYAQLYRTTSSYSLETIVINILKRSNGEYQKYTLYESYVPPVEYDRIQFGINAEQMRISRLDIPVLVPPDSSLLVDFYQDFKVEENKVTEIIFQISPFKSVVRFKDVYYFMRKIEVVEVKYH
jgi:hypothetical protein